MVVRCGLAGPCMPPEADIFGFGEVQHVPKNRELEPERMGLTSPPAPLRVRECAIARADREFAAGIAAIEGHAYDHAVAMAPISWPGH